MAQLNDLLVAGASRLLNGLGVLGTTNSDSILPNTTDTYVLGESGKRWNSAYIKTITGSHISLDTLTVNNYATIGGGQAATAINTGALRVKGGLSTEQNSFFGKSIILTPAASQGIKINAAYITSENTSNGEVIFQGGHLRFGGSTWAYDNWGGLKYDHSTKTVYLGIADGSIFAANTAQSGGTLALPGVRYLSINGKIALDAVDSWLRINEAKAFSSGIYFGSNVVRTDGQLQVGDAGKQFYANSNGNGYFSNTLGIGGTNTSYKLYVNGKTRVGDGAASTSTTTGGLIVGGGIGVSGNSYFGGTVTATKFIGPLQGNASTATTLQTARTINGTSFNGSTNITTANWGTARTLTVGNTGKSVNGAGNVSWSLSEIGALPTTGGTMSGDISFATIASWPTVSGETYPIESKGLYWSGSSDLVKLFYRVVSSDGGKFIIQLGDSTDEEVIVENTAGTVYAKIGNGGVTANNFYGNATSATYLKDKTNGTASYLNYGSSGMSSASWYGAWDGYTLRAISPANLATHLATNTLDARYVNISGDSMTGTLTITPPYQATASSRYHSSALEIREAGGVTSNQSDIGYAPRIGFHWGGRVAASLAFHSDGAFYFRNQADSGQAPVYASTFYGALSGNATTATTLKTTRTLTIGNTGKSFNGSSNVSWTLAEIGAVAKTGDTMTGPLTISHATTATMTSATTNPRIIFSESGTQPVALVYTDYDSYRNPAGLKVLGMSSDSSKAWFEVEGKIYSDGKLVMTAGNFSLSGTTLTITTT